MEVFEPKESVRKIRQECHLGASADNTVYLSSRWGRDYVPGVAQHHHSNRRPSRAFTPPSTLTIILQLNNSKADQQTWGLAFAYIELPSGSSSACVCLRMVLSMSTRMTWSQGPSFLTHLFSIIPKKRNHQVFLLDLGGIWGPWLIEPTPKTGRYK